MFETEVKIYEDHLHVGRKTIPYTEIVGIKTSQDFLRRIAPHYPTITLYLSTGRGLYITNQQHKLVDSAFYQFSESDRFASLKEFLAQKCTTSDKFSSWFSWRLILPIAIIQPLLFCAFWLAGYPFQQAHITTLLLSILFVIPGFIWERRARRSAADAVLRG